ncbi:MAG: HEPN domain-containing protein [Rubrobacteraceae bacterium]
MSDGPEILDNLLAKARRSLQVAEGLLEDGHADFAASRAYYGCFYVAEALLFSEGLSYSRHSQVVAQFGRHFAKTGELDARYHRLLI